MTTLRPENTPGLPDGFEDTAEFEAAVDQLADPLTDPLPIAGSAPARWPRPSSATPGAMPYPTVAPQPQPQPAPQVTAQLPLVEPPGAPRRAERPTPRRAETTAPLPVVPPAEADPVPGGRAARRRAARSGHAAQPPSGEPELPPAPGGRAARRKAAKHGGRAPAAAPTPASAPRQPTSRLEARRAARAAKDSPGVIACRVLGEVFITIGALMLLFVAYQLWWTNVLAHEASNSAANSLQHQWNSKHSSNDDRNPGAFSPGQGFAIIYIPKLDVEAPIAEGTDKTKILDKGMVGHYSGAQATAMPWAKTGNFALAGHRNTHGEPFRYINKLVPGDKVVVETASTYYTYEVTSMLPQTSPANVGVIQPIPVGSGFTQPGRYITLTTCTPEFTSKYRLIVWGKMVDVRPRSEGKPDALLGG
ncbi:class E sortase [Streptantibioticus rubrisoli]|uniref:Class E sortase n=1 Tax=Streptantibioticus rubrisoli TaxID=1387313 RepID=A0ABT1P9X3_9ACTN|nr:class E sortase [Streptantibioticus rubrisoli]MCQ4042177.1 class E sortase [Streptantibioticus rubrisoli]